MKMGATFTGSADDAYDEIRRNGTDVEVISRNTGIKPANIQKVKNHIFYDEHLLDRYTELGVPAEWRRFDSDLAIAQAWKRLQGGDHTVLDMRLLRHEAAEMNRMRKVEQRYSAAHDAAPRRYPAPEFKE